MSAFKTPLAVRITSQEQADECVKALKELGYEWVADNKNDWGEYPYLLTNYDKKGLGYYLNNRSRIAIETYNLPLVKALAAMREGDEFYRGEWLYCHTDLVMEDDGRIEATNGKLYLSEWTDCFTNNSGNDYHGLGEQYPEWFHKATVEEILTHFGMAPKKQEQAHMSAFKGDIAGFPPEVVELILKRQEEQGNLRDVTVFEKDREAGQSGGGIGWAGTPEGYAFWRAVIIKEDFPTFFAEYPRQSQPEPQSAPITARTYSTEEMALLDGFAGRAMQGVSTAWMSDISPATRDEVRAYWADHYGSGKAVDEYIAADAYHIAAAMLAERAKYVSAGPVDAVNDQNGH